MDSQKVKTHLSYIGVIAVLIVIIILLQKCGGRSCPPPTVVTTTVRDTIPGDSIPYPIEVPKPYPVVRDSIIWKTQIKYEIDTLTDEELEAKALEVLIKYYTINHYVDTLSDDSTYVLVLKERVFQNEITDREVLFQNLKFTALSETRQTITYETLPRLRLYVGLIGGAQNGKFGAGVDVTILPRNDRFLIGYSWDGINKAHYGRFGYKLRFRRK